MNLNRYADERLPENIKKELNEKEIEFINQIDLKAGYFWLFKWLSIGVSIITLILSIAFSSKIIFFGLILIVNASFYFSIKENKYMDIQDNYLDDLIFLISLEKLEKEKGMFK